MNESMVDESMVSKSNEIESQVNESILKVLVLPAPCSLLPAPTQWRTGTVPALLKAQCTFHSKQAVIIVNGELGRTGSILGTRSSRITGERINGGRINGEQINEDGITVEQINGAQILGERINDESAPAPRTLLPASCSR